MFDFDPRDLTDSRDRYSEDVYDRRWGEDPRDRDERDREVDSRDRNPRDPFVDGLALPRGMERELVQDEHENLYELNGEDARMLATIGAFRIVAEHDLEDVRDASADPRGDTLDHLADEGLIRFVDIDANERAAVLTDDGLDVLEAHQRDPDDERGQEFHAELGRERELQHDAQLFAAYREVEQRLRDEGAKVAPGALHRGRLFHVHYKPLYEAIAEGNNRNRRPATLGRMIERLMILDAVLADRRYTWLGTERDKVAYLKAFLHEAFGLEDVPQMTFGEDAAKTTRYFPDKLPIGLEADYGPRHVFLYLVTRELPGEFRRFLFHHAQLLKAVDFWTIRLLIPCRFRKAVPLYRCVVRDELASPLKPSEVDELEWVFGLRAGQPDVQDVPAGLELGAASKRLRAARFRARYRMWQVEPYNALADLYSHILPDQLARGEGRVELVELPHQYLRLT